MNPILSVDDIVFPDLSREKFLTFIERREDNECWNWKYSLNQGRGMFTVQYKKDRTFKKVYSHRLAWIFFRGPIINNLCVLHTCDNPKCCNPNHLYLGTKQDNAIDREERNRGGTQRQEVKDRIRKTLTGRKLPEETIEKMREAAIRRYSQ